MAEEVKQTKFKLGVRDVKLVHGVHAMELC